MNEQRKALSSEKELLHQLQDAFQSLSTFVWKGESYVSTIKTTIHSTGDGLCSLSGKESDGLTVTFDDGTVKEAFLSWKSFRQLLALKNSQAVKPEPKASASQPATPPVATAMK